MTKTDYVVGTPDHQQFFEEWRTDEGSDVACFNTDPKKAKTFTRAEQARGLSGLLIEASSYWDNTKNEAQSCPETRAFIRTIDTTYTYEAV